MDKFTSEENKDLKKLLQFLALFPSIEIQFEILEKILDDKDLNIKLQALVEKKWLSEDNGCYKFDKNIQDIINNDEALVYENITYALENISTYIDPYNSTLIAKSLSAYRVIVERLLTLFKEKSDNYIAGLLDSMTFLHYATGEYKEALLMQEKSCTIRETLFGEKSAVTAKSYDLLGVIYMGMKNYEKALPFYEKALQIREELLGEKNIDTATSYNNLAGFYDAVEKYVKAEPLHLKALEIKEALHGAEHASTARSYWNIALFYKRRKACIKAKDFFEKTKKIIKKLEYFEVSEIDLNRALAEVEKNLKKEAKAKFNKRGRFCIEELS